MGIINPEHFIQGNLGYQWWVKVTSFRWAVDAPSYNGLWQTGHPQGI